MATNDDEGGERPDGYIGNGHPPKQHRFGPGNKANPHGRKGKPRKIDFLDERERRRPDDGKWRWFTRDQMIDHALYKATLLGNVSAAKLLMVRRQSRMAKDAEAVEPDVLGSAEEAALLRAVERRLRDDEGPVTDDRDAAEGQPEDGP